MAVASARAYSAVSSRWVGIGLVILAFILLAVGFVLGISTVLGIVLLVLFVIFLIVGLYLIFAGPGTRWGLAGRGSAPATVPAAAASPAAQPVAQPVVQAPATTTAVPVAATAAPPARAGILSGSSARFCPACGSPVTGEGKYCANCGRALP